MNYLEELNNINECYLNSECSLECAIDTLSKYKDIIPKFFSDNGEAKGIIDLYNAVKNNDKTDSWYHCCDLNIAHDKYSNYLGGMTKFMNDLNSACCEDKCDEAMLNKINTGISRDPMFIESILGGEMNKCQDMVATDAICNLEYLIDFIPHLTSYIGLFKQAAIDYDLTKEPVKKAIKMLSNSICLYTFSVIHLLFELYGKLRKVYCEPQVTNNEEKKAFVLA